MSQSYPLWDFHGGIHPPEHKLDSNQTPIQRAPLPDIAVLPLNQHKGVPAEPVVEVGDQVKTGQIIAEAQGLVSAHIHASVTGKVIAIEDRPIAHPSGLSSTCIVIARQGDDQWQTLPSLNWRTSSTLELVTRFREAGLAGLGGAAFPTDVKYRSEKLINTLILNGAECEPYITADDLLMREKAKAILIGGQIMAQALDAKHILVGIEDNKPEAIVAINDALHQLGDKRIELRVVPTKYPSGASNQLIQLLTGLEVPSDGHASDLGIVCQNVGTAYAVQQAVEAGIPLVERVTTLTGDGCQTTGNYWIRLGTPFQQMIDIAGAQPDQVIMGGPLMGFTIQSAEVPVVKATNCILIPEKAHQPNLAAPCIRCGMCEQICPANLLPQQLYWNAKNHEWERARLNSLDDCIECGACAYVCPSEIPLVDYYRFAKAELKKEQIELVKSDRARERFEFRQARLEKEAEEKEVRRKARAEAAAKAQKAKQAANTDSTLSDDKKAEIAAAVARAREKKGQTNTSAAPTIEQLQAKYQAAQNKVEKARARLAEAEQNQPEQVQALTLALNKLTEKALQAEKALQQAGKEQQSTESN